MGDIKGNDTRDLYICYPLGGALSVLPFCCSFDQFEPKGKMKEEKQGKSPGVPAF